MSQVLNSLVVSGELGVQRALEDIMSNNIEGYILSFTSYPMDHLSEIDREPDLIFIDNQNGALKPEAAHKVIVRFPRKTCIVLNENPDDSRRAFLKAGIDEVMSLSELRSGLGRHLLEKLLAMKDLADAETRIEQSEERFRGIIENSHDIITLLDAEGTVLYTSPAFGRQLGYESWEVLGQSFFDFINADERKSLDHALHRIIQDPATPAEPMEFQFKSKNGEWRTFESIATNLLKNETVQALVLNSRDVTEQKRTEIELEDYRNHLEELVEKRTRELELRSAELSVALEKEKEIVEQQKMFISTVSHEFRTPLTIIDGNAQIIQRRGDVLGKDALEKRAGTIRSSVERLVRLIETILSAHMLESGRLYVQTAPCDLAKIIRDVCTEQGDVSPQHDIRLDIEALSGHYLLDEKMMRQMMTNLISNAIKYSPKSARIDVRARTGGGEIVIDVEDHGVGIPEAEFSKMFSKYFRASTSGGIPGSGLGLHLVRQFVELHEGSIDLSSKVGEGTTFTIHLPAQTGGD